MAAAEPSLAILEAAYLQQQVVKNAKHILAGPKYLSDFLTAIKRQIRIEKKLAEDFRLPRHKRALRYEREMQFVEYLKQYKERICMSFEDNETVLSKYLTDSNWMKALYIEYLQQTESKLTGNKSKLQLRVDKLTAIYLDELLERHIDVSADDKANQMTWMIQTAIRNLIGKGVAPDTSIMSVGESDSLFSMLNKLQLIEIFYAKGMATNYVKLSTLAEAMDSILKPLRALHRGRKSTSEIFTLFKAALKALRSLYSCYGGDHMLSREDRVVFTTAALGNELNFWLKVSLDVRNGKDFLLARREHRQHDFDADAPDDSSSVASGWQGSVGAENNNSFARVVNLIGNGLIHDLLWCVNSFVIACTHDATDIEQLKVKYANDLAQQEKDRSQQQNNAASKSSKRPQHSSYKEAMGISHTTEPTGRNVALRPVDESHVPPPQLLAELLENALKFSRIVTQRYSFMQHAASHGNPALGNVALIRAADEEVVISLDVASTMFSLGKISPLAIDILEAGLSLCYSRSQNCNIAIATFQCTYKAALCVMQGGHVDSEQGRQDVNPGNLTKMIYRVPDPNTTRGRLLTVLGRSSLKIMHIMNTHSMSLSIAHIGLGVLRLLAREQFMKRADIDQLVGLEEDDYEPDPEENHADLAESGSIATKTTPSLLTSSVSAPSTARRSAGQVSRFSSPTRRSHSLDDGSVVSDMGSTVSVASSTGSLALDEALPYMDDATYPVERIFVDWMHTKSSEIFPSEVHSHGHGISAGDHIPGKHAHIVGIASLLCFIGDSHSQCIEVVEQLLLLVYHLGKSSYTIKIALLEQGFEKIIIQLSVTSSHNHYVSALCSLAQEALQMDQIVV